MIGQTDESDKEKSPATSGCTDCEDAQGNLLGAILGAALRGNCCPQHLTISLHIEGPADGFIGQEKQLIHSF